MKPNYENLKLSTSVVLFFRLMSFLLDLLELKYRSEKVMLLYSTANRNNTSCLRRVFYNLVDYNRGYFPIGILLKVQFGRERV